MGLLSYFKAERPDKKQRKAASRPTNQGVLEKSEHEPAAHEDLGLQPPTPQFTSSRNSVSGYSVGSSSSSLFLEEIKHQVMVNYLYQQQCSQLWVNDGSGEIEGVLIRKSKGQYMACPSQLGNSPFAVACAALNVQAS